MKKLLFLFWSLISIFSANAQDADYTFTEGPAVIQTFDAYNASNIKVRIVTENLVSRGYTPNGVATKVAGTFEGNPVEWLVKDYNHPDGTTASQIYLKGVDGEYSALNIYKNPNDEAANYGYEEWFVNQENQLQLTHSFFSCFFNVIWQRCGGNFNAGAIWNSCKKYVPFRLGQFVSCIYNKMLGQARAFLNCLWNNLWSAVWRCI